jgi:hypothetical protein
MEKITVEDLIVKCQAYKHIIEQQAREIKILKEDKERYLSMLSMLTDNLIELKAVTNRLLYKENE